MKISDLISEAPLPDTWERQAFKHDANSFKDIVQYAQIRAKAIGTGTARTVFKIEYHGRPTALKIAKNRAGLAQNSLEARVLSDRHFDEITIPMIDFDTDNTPSTWIHVEMAKPMTSAAFKRMTGFNFELFSRILGQVTPRTKPIHHEIWQSDIRQLVTSLCQTHRLHDSDFMRLENWGIYDGHPVLIDLGFDDEVYNLHYRDKSPGALE